MLDWLKRRFAQDQSPMYSAIKAVPSRGVPQALDDREASTEHLAEIQAAQARWQEVPLRPDDEAPLVTILSAPQQNGFITLSLAEGRCLPLFTSPFRAMDYAAVRLRQTANVPVTVTSAAGLARSLPELTAAGVTHVAVNICPRCDVVLMAGVENLASVDMAMTICTMALGSRDARRDLYLRDAEERFRAGDRSGARDVALELVAHVDAEDPRAHWLMGQIAIDGRDADEFREALRFLELLGHHGWRTRLDEGWTSQTSTLDYPARLDRV